MAAMAMARSVARPVQVARACRRVQQLSAKAPARVVYYHTRRAVVVAAAETEDVEAEEEEEVGEMEMEEEVGGIEDWAAEKLARLQMEENSGVEFVPSYSLNFLYLDKNIAVAVDQVYSKGQRSPLTEYFFWPRKDAWEELKAALEAKPWIAERDRVLMLNTCTEVINFWQDETKHTLAEAQAKFTECKIQGS